MPQIVRVPRRVCPGCGTHLTESELHCPSCGALTPGATRGPAPVEERDTGVLSWLLTGLLGGTLAGVLAVGAAMCLPAVRDAVIAMAPHARGNEGALALIGAALGAPGSFPRRGMVGPNPGSDISLEAVLTGALTGSALGAFLGIAGRLCSPAAIAGATSPLAGQAILALPALALCVMVGGAVGGAIARRSS